ncbi:MAG: Gfo/Idh/MocA family protein [Phycisphaerae bacterium]
MSSTSAVVVGAGGISRAWFGPLKEECVDVRAVVDLNVENAKGRIAEFELDAEASDDLQATLEKHQPDFVVDLTVPEAHCQVTCTALEAGCHVIGEKPMAASMAQARQMVRIAEKTGKLYMVSQSRRWNQTHKRIAKAVAGGALGDLTVANCEFYIGAHFGGFRAEMESPLILDMAIHHFDLARMFTAADPVSVYAHEFNPKGSWYDGDVAATCIFEMSDGLVFTYVGSWCAEGCNTSWEGDWRLIGTDGSLRYAGGAEPVAEKPVGSDGLIWKTEPIEIPAADLPRPTMHGALLEMLAYLETGKVPQTECHDNIQSLAMVFAAMESSRAGRKVAIEAI